MARHAFLEEVLDLCSEQGYRYAPLTGRNASAYRVYPKDPAIPSVIVYPNNGIDKRWELNARAQLRRIGVLFPIDAQRLKNQQKEELMALNGSNGASKSLSNAETEKAVNPKSLDVNPFDTVRQKISAAMGALADLEEAINTIESDTKGLQQLRDVMRSIRL